MRPSFLAVILIFFTSAIYSQNADDIIESSAAEKAAEKYFLVEKSKMEQLEVVRFLDHEHVIATGTPSPDQATKAINDEWKWATPYDSTDKGLFYVQSKKSLKGRLKNIHFLEFDPISNQNLVEGNVKDIRNEILGLSDVTYLQKASRVPKTESSINSHDLSVNRINYVHNQYSELDGALRTISIKEDAFDTSDIDIIRRSVLDQSSSSQISNHATDMATLIAGAGNSFINGTGVATRANLLSEDFESLLPGPNSYFLDNGVTVQNHSYGVDVENFYGIESFAFDNQAQSIPNLLHIFSSGNSGESDGTGVYTGISGFANLTGSFKQAKNVLLVTGSDSKGNVPASNSSGPTYDGRIKPELTAYGESGTSDAAALASGASLLLQDRWLVKTGSLPDSDMIKSLLIAGSEDIMNEGPDFKSGYGQMNLFHSIQIIDSMWYDSGNIQNEESVSFDVQIDEPLKQLQVVLCWRDPAANNGDFSALINDLDLKISKDQEEYLPWLLDSSPNENSLGAAATRGEDHINNVEMISIDAVDPGVYTIEVSGLNITGSQSFSLAYFKQHSDQFTWTFPTKNDPLEAGSTIDLRWENTFESTGILEIDFLNDDWQIINPAIESGDHSQEFLLPNEYTSAVLKMTINGSIFKSDTFSISPKPDLQVGLLCEDEMILNWNSLHPMATYQVTYLNSSAGLNQAIVVTTDTFAIIDRTKYPNNYFSVRTIDDDILGLQDETLRVDRQGVGCYLSNFVVSRNLIDQVVITLNLSLPQLMDQVTINRSFDSSVEAIQQFEPTESNNEFIDEFAGIGKNVYQAILELTDGRMIFSDEIPLYNTDDKKFILFPNPISEGQINFLSPKTPALFQIFKSDGTILRDYEIISEYETIPINQLPNGMYFYRVMMNGEAINSGRFVIN